MRHMLIVKSNQKTEDGAPPDEPFLNAIEKYNKELTDAGVMVTGEGIYPSSAGARLTLENGTFEVQNGPFENPETLIGGYWVVDTNTTAEAVEWAKRCPFKVEGSAYADGFGQIEVRPLIEMPGEEEPMAFSDQNSSSETAGTGKKRFLSMIKSDAKIESGEMPPPEVIEAMGGVMAPLIEDGTLIAADGLQPSSNGVRVTFSNGTPVITDGPFAETKELVGGFAMLRADSLEEAAELTKQAALVESKWRDEPITFEIRQLYSETDFE